MGVMGWDTGNERNALIVLVSSFSVFLIEGCFEGFSFGRAFVVAGKMVGSSMVRFTNGASQP